METGKDDFTLGEEVTTGTRAGKPVGMVVSARLERELADRLLGVSEATGKKLSQLVREALLAYLEHRPDQDISEAGTQITIGACGGHMNAVSTAKNSVLTSSGLADHTEHLLKVS